MASLAIFIAIFAIYPFALVWKAYVLVVMWAWFVQPDTGLAAPSIYATAGMLLILSLAIYRHHPQPKDRTGVEQFSEAIAHGFFLPLFALGTAWVWKWLQWGIV